MSEEETKVAEETVVETPVVAAEDAETPTEEEAA
jgi:hypothetical protein